MPHRMRLALVGVIALTALAAGHAWYPALSSPSVVPGVGLADIEVGMPIGDVLTRFGTPSVVRITGTDDLLGYAFDQYGIIVYVRGDIVQAVGTTNSVIGSVNGIGLGSSAPSVVQALGRTYSSGYVEGYPALVYAGLGMALGMDRNAVAAILVFRPAQSVGQPATPAAPQTSVTPPAQTNSGAPAGSVQARTTIPGLAPSLAQPSTGKPGATATAPATPGAASTATAAPDVTHLKPYTVDTHFLSLAGYLRYLVHRESKTWMSPDQSERFIQGGADTVAAP
jgi:hypothetical protein